MSCEDGSPDPSGYVAADPHFGALRAQNIHFYQDNLPKWAAVVHSSGAPPWLARQIMEAAAASKKKAQKPQTEKAKKSKEVPGISMPAEVALILNALEGRLDEVEASVAAIQAELFQSMTVVAAGAEVEEEAAGYE